MTPGCGSWIVSRAHSTSWGTRRSARDRVIDKRIEGSHHVVELKLAGTNQRGEVTVPGTATVILPSRVKARSYCQRPGRRESARRGNAAGGSGPARGRQSMRRPTICRSGTPARAGLRAVLRHRQSLHRSKYGRVSHVAARPTSSAPWRPGNARTTDLECPQARPNVRGLLLSWPSLIEPQPKHLAAAGGARQRQALLRDAAPGAHGGRLVPLLRGPGRQNRRRRDPHRQAQHVHLYAT